jgi:hypothetical protein
MLLRVRFSHVRGRERVDPHKSLWH